MRAVYQRTRQVAPSKATVLLMGETGTGKEMIARAVHECSPRQNGPFIGVNCGALSENLLESELFGHVRGAFTGAIENRTGRFQAAHTGTLFLDEVDAMSPMLQVKLLRVLQQREFERVGDTQTIRVDTRVVAASNRKLRKEVARGNFRKDLYYRLNVVPITLPPLRERHEDIPDLIAHFLQIYNEENDRVVVHVSPQAMLALTAYEWPGNVRELQNYVERAVVLAPGDELTFDILPRAVRQGKRDSSLDDAGHDSLDHLARRLVERGLIEADETATNLHELIVNQVERELIAQVMATCENVRIRAAKRLGINRNTLHKKLRDYELDGNRDNEAPGTAESQADH
ncbi:MAG: sigma-54 dependent transcriptional regulator [Pirellulales bacterium]|nr:sigma-54 dependent transcriptional regulator [Pirellulales bacterium]